MALGLRIDSQSFDIEGAWKHNTSIRRLRSTIATKGENTPKPGEDGATEHPVLKREVVVDMELMVFGRKNNLGVAYIDALSGLDENLAYLEDWVYDHTDGTAVSYLAQLESVSGRTFETNVQILNWQIAQENTVQVVVSYDLRIPSGRWTETTP